MTEELIMPENLSPTHKALFDDKFMETHPARDGKQKVKERHSLHVRPSWASFASLPFSGFKPSTPIERQLKVVNRVNQEFVIICATAGDNESVCV